jgi:hypothetical protein
MFRACRLIAGPYSTIRVNPVLLTVEPLLAVTVMLYVPVGEPGFGGGGGSGASVRRIAESTAGETVFDLTSLIFIYEYITI